MTEYTNTAIVFGRVKNAALYFDKLIPVNLGAELAPQVYSKNFVLEEIDRTLFPEKIVQDPEFAKELVSVNVATSDLLLKFAARRFSLPKPEHFTEWKYRRLDSIAVRKFFRFVEKYNLSNLPIDSGDDLFAESESIQDSEFVVSLAGLDLIDTKDCSWEQIREFRRDAEAQNKLRRLRLFAQENYGGKSKTFVEDDIQLRIDDYKFAIRKWGFETTDGAISSVLTSKILGSAVVGTLVSALAGSPSTATAAIVAGGLLEMGRVSLKVSKSCFALEALRRDHPVSFISYARDKLRPRA